MLSSTCEVCNSKKSKFMKEQHAQGLISNLIEKKKSIHSDLYL